MTKLKRCPVCDEALPRKLPHCDLTPLAVPLPYGVELCFWCRRDLLGYVGDPEQVDENQINLWVAQWLRTASSRKAQNLPLGRCEVGRRHDRCARFAAKQREDGVWVCGWHAQPRYARLRRYSDWRSQRVTDTIILPPRPKPERPRDAGQRGSANANASLTDDNVRVIKRLIAEGEFNTTIAARFGVTHSLISAIRRKKCWTHIPEVVEC